MPSRVPATQEPLRLGLQCRTAHNVQLGLPAELLAQDMVSFPSRHLLMRKRRMLGVAVQCWGNSHAPSQGQEMAATMPNRANCRAEAR